MILALQYVWYHLRTCPHEGDHTWSTCWRWGLRTWENTPEVPEDWASQSLHLARYVTRIYRGPQELVIPACIRSLRSLNTHVEVLDNFEDIREIETRRVAIAAESIQAFLDVAEKLMVMLGDRAKICPRCLSIAERFVQ